MRTATLDRARDRSRDLVEFWGDSLHTFIKRDVFSGPSLYFHHKTLERLPDNTPVKVLDDEIFFDYLYAVLASWGLHRMGVDKTKLDELDNIKGSLRSARSEIQELSAYNITTLDSTKVVEVADVISGILDKLRVSKSETKLVAGSKALHHILPSLVPPVDREYTLRFFFNNTTNASLDRFLPVFCSYWFIAKQKRDSIRERLNDGGKWDTSETKVIDNAIVGYVFLKNLKKKQSNTEAYD